MEPLTGKIKFIGDTLQVSEKFRKRDFVVTDNSSQYPQHISFQLTQDKCSLIEGYSVGSDIKVHYNLRGREWTSPKGEVKYFNTIEAWRLEKVGTGNNAAPQANTNNSTPTASASVEMPETSFSASSQDDDLPF